MLRLLQGDVGSGKTIVALMSMLNAVECGTQAAIMAPTEILAKQHLETMQPLCEEIGIRAELLTGRIKGKARARILEDLEAGKLTFLSVRTRCSWRLLLLKTWPASSSTNSTVSASISVWRFRTRATNPTFWS